MAKAKVEKLILKIDDETEIVLTKKAAQELHAALDELFGSDMEKLVRHVHDYHPPWRTYTYWSTTTPMFIGNSTAADCVSNTYTISANSNTNDVQLLEKANG